MSQNRRTSEKGVDLNKIKLLVSDFDGVMTDNRVLVREDGLEHVFCNRSDGLGIRYIKDMGIDVIVLSTEENNVVNARCQKLDIECYQGKSDKLGCLKEIIARRELELSDVSYVGNDINDLECLEHVGVAIVVSDAHEDVKKVADIILNTSGGNGVFMELYEIMKRSKTYGQR